MQTRSQLFPILLAIFVIAPVQVSSAADPESGACDKQHWLRVGSFGAFSEMVAAGVKKLALSAPMRAAEADAFMADAERIAAQENVKIYREPELLVTDLFPADVAKDKDVILIYRGSTLEEYLVLKKQKAGLVASGHYAGKRREDIGRAFGKLLSYPDAVINEKMRAVAKNK